MPRKRNFVPIFGSSSSHAKGASLSSTAAAGTSTSIGNPLIRESDGISQTNPVPAAQTNPVPAGTSSSNAHSSMPATSDDTVDSYANIKLQRRGGRRSQHIVPPMNNIMPPEGETRIRLWCCGKNSFIPYNAARRLGTIIRDHYSGPYPNWTGTPTSQVKVWWGIFKKDYWWPVEEHVLVWENFNAIGACRLRDSIRKARENVEKGKGVPLWLGDTNWKALQALSSTEEFKKKSAINKHNRLMNNAYHSCGSIPISEHKRRLAKDFKREPHVDEIFTHTHKRRDGTFVDDRARDTIAKYNEGMARATQMTESGSSQLKMTPLEVFAEAAGGMKKGKLYGLGSESSVVSGSLLVPSHFVSESSQQRNAENVDDLRQQMATMTEQMTQMQKKINELENKGPPPGHPSAEEIGAVVFAKMSTLFPAFGGQ